MGTLLTNLKTTDPSGKVSLWSPVKYNHSIHLVSKAINLILQQQMVFELNCTRVQWKNVRDLNHLRLLHSRWRGEKWIRRLWRESTCSRDDVIDFNTNNKNGLWIYAMFNFS